MCRSFASDTPVVLADGWAGDPPPEARIEIVARTGGDLDPIEPLDDLVIRRAGRHEVTSFGVHPGVVMVTTIVAQPNLPTDATRPPPKRGPLSSSTA